MNQSVAGYLRGISAIAGKDLRSVFFSPLFYVIAGLCSLVWSIMYAIALTEFAQTSLMMMMQSRGEGQGPSLHFEVFARHISLVNFLMILAVAAMTMRLFAEEKKQRTFDLLLTSPVTATQIVMGKFLAGLLSAWALVALSAIYPLVLTPFTSMAWGPLASAYIGVLLLVGCYVAVGMFASSLTESAVLAVVMSLIFSVGLWFVGAGAEAFSDQPTLSKVFEHLSIGQHFVGFIRGGFSVASLVFFVSVIFLYGFLTQRVVESARWR